ncbi:hypothetical protein BpHYR1_043364 [Brachionus plicatilis]|uniref:Uncharacterized protein n=1 Tax=Brachionus plicatilis TaxID=10195 RepID=A0A3M7RN75_BRAPC|nr:hypothetical protein BpHYR1_043364 [Brachionus plicatilis]
MKKKTFIECLINGRLNVLNHNRFYLRVNFFQASNRMLLIVFKNLKKTLSNILKSLNILLYIFLDKNDHLLEMPNNGSLSN